MKCVLRKSRVKNAGFGVILTLGLVHFAIAQSLPSGLDPSAPDNWNDRQAYSYIATWPDLIFALGSDTNAAKQHFKYYGFFENRHVDATSNFDDFNTFDPASYLANSQYASAQCGSAVDPLACAASLWINGGWSENANNWTDLFALTFTASYVNLTRAYGIDVPSIKAYYNSTGKALGQTPTFNVVDWANNTFATNGSDPYWVDALNSDYVAALRFYIRNGNTAWTDSTKFWLYNQTYCVGVLNGTLSVGSKVVTAKCSDAVTQKWQFRVDGTVRAASNPNLCMVVSNGATVGNGLYIDNCSSALAPDWDPSGLQSVISTSTGLCMDTGDSQLGFGKGLVLNSCDETLPGQRWLPSSYSN